MQKSVTAKVVITILALIFVAVLGTLVQHLLFGKNNVAITSAVISVFAVTMWRLFWRSTK